jgi:hypothetical protein
MQRPPAHHTQVRLIIDIYLFSGFHVGKEIVSLVDGRLCRIDVNVPKEDVENLHDILSEETPTPSQVKDEDGKMSLKVNLDRNQVINSVICNSSEPINPLVNILDVCLTLVFESLESTVGVESESDDPHSLDSFYESMFETFEREVMPSFGVNHVQFVYFYILSAQPAHCQKFLEFLWKRAINVNSPAIVRVQSMSYIAGILARANFATVK